MINKEKNIWQQIIPHVVCVALFFIITFVFFKPQFDGKVIPQDDVTQYQGMSQELKEYHEKEGLSSAWTGSMFSGMPAYQIGVRGGTPNFIDYLEVPARAFGGNTAGALLTMMVAAYIMFCVMRFRPEYAFLGAIAYALSSYNIVILEVGHITKAWAIAYMPLIVGSMAAMFRRKYLLGGLLLGLGLALQLKNNHLQITYYTGILCLILFVGLVVDMIQKKEIKGLVKATAILSIAAILGLAANMGRLYENYTMAEESIRGKTELTNTSETEKQSSGVDIDYAFAWSYSKLETFTMLIPNIYGGSTSEKLGADSKTYKMLKNAGQQLPADGVDMPTYWGGQPGTSGPVYFGAVVVFLFVLGMIVVRSRMKWVLLGATLFFVFLSWGYNMMWFNDLIFHHLPMYSKFRAITMSLVIPALTMLIVGVWGLKELLESDDDAKARLKQLYLAGGISVGLCLLIWIGFSMTYNFITPREMANEEYRQVYLALASDRKDMLSGDVFRSVIFILLAVATLWLMLKKGVKENKNLYLGGLSVMILLVLIDLWGVDRRYINESIYVAKTYNATNVFKKTVADEAILQDKSPSYRVLNLNNTFTESITPYYHKSIGGYHPAKMRRYQELIEYYLAAETQSVINSLQTNSLDSITANLQYLPMINMLNGRYIIFNPQQPPIANPYAMGNAWFVPEYKIVGNADEEIYTLGRIDPAQTAIVDKQFEPMLAGLNIATDSTATIVMTEYKPNKVTYKSKAGSEQFAVFSEVYFRDGWQAYMDGKPVDHFRANWILRGMRVAAGEHEIEFCFEPANYQLARTVSAASSAILVLLLFGVFILYFVKREKTEA